MKTTISCVACFCVGTALGAMLVHSKSPTTPTFRVFIHTGTQTLMYTNLTWKRLEEIVANPPTNKTNINKIDLQMEYPAAK